MIDLDLFREIFQSLNAQVPSFGHNPLMLNDDGTKLLIQNQGAPNN